MKSFEIIWNHFIKYINNPVLIYVKIIFQILKLIKSAGVIFDRYNGPESQLVDYQFRIRKFESYIAVNYNVIVAIVDGRGTSANGEKFEKAVYKQLGKLETIDQIELAK